MKKLIITSLLLVSVLAASISLNQKNVFVGEDFDVTYSAEAPLSQHTEIISFGEQNKEVFVPTKTSGTFESTVSFTATKPGEFDLNAEGITKVVEVKEGIMKLTNVIITPENTKVNEPVKITFTIKNVGDLSVYNVKSKVKVLGDNPYEKEENITEIMGSGEEMTLIKTVIPETRGQDQIKLTIFYEYDNEVHEMSKVVGMTTGTIPVLEIIGLSILIILFGRFVLPKILPEKKS